MSDKLQAAKDAILEAIAHGRAPQDTLEFAKSYRILCETEQTDLVCPYCGIFGGHHADCGVIKLKGE